MANNKPQRLSEIVPLYISQGGNDAKWILIEHQLAQAKMSAQIARSTVHDIVMSPENADEGKIAFDCGEIVGEMLLDILEHYAIFLSYLSGTDVSAKMGRKEL